jgi:hypothetical protein
MVILGKMAHFFSSFVDLLLKVSQPGYLLLFPLHLLMNDFQVPDLLVQLLLLKCWAGSLSFLAFWLLRERLSPGSCPVATVQPLALLSSSAACRRLMLCRRLWK